MTWLEQATALFGTPAVAVAEPQKLGDRERRCWVWFVDGSNYNVALDRDHRGHWIRANGPDRRAELWIRHDPTDEEIRAACTFAWPAFSPAVAS